MKLLNVFGLVVGAHVAVFAFVFATPGCRSTGQQKPRPEDTGAAAAAAADPTYVDQIASVPSSDMSDADLNPATAAPASRVAPVATFAPPQGSSAAGVRFAPTRPVGETAPGFEAAPAPRATHTVAKGDSLWSVSRKYGIGVDELAAANQLSKSAPLRLGQELVVPAKPAASADTDAANTYEVRSGDTLGAIARRQGTTVSALRAANNLSGDRLRVGQRLVIPGNAAPLSSSGGNASAAVSAPASAPRASSVTYTVQPGDTLGAIARRHGVRSGEIATLNTITDPAKLRVGQVLRLPSGARATASAASRSEAAPVSTPTVAPAPAPAPTLVVPVAPIGEPEPSGVTPVEPVEQVEPFASPVIRID
jgi:LysM repeat protein